MAVFLSFDVGVRNLAVCKVEVLPGAGHNGVASSLSDSKMYTIHHWTVLDVLEATPDVSVKTLGIPVLAQRMLDTLSAHEAALLHTAPVPTAILIEQQPGGKFVNVSMKALSHVLQAFLYLKAPHVPIHFVSARKKLVKADAHEKGTAQKKRYSSNKQFAKEETQSILQEQVTNSEEALTLFHSRSKKDDLADCFLQALAFYNTSLPAPKKRRVTKK